jgi:hypothetical protein
MVRDFGRAEKYSIDPWCNEGGAEYLFSNRNIARFSEADII